jgi:hypothetical protein
VDGSSCFRGQRFAKKLQRFRETLGVRRQGLAFHVDRI